MSLFLCSTILLFNFFLKCWYVVFLFLFSEIFVFFCIVAYEILAPHPKIEHTPLQWKCAAQSLDCQENFHYHTVLMAVALQCGLKSWSTIKYLQLFFFFFSFFLKIALAIWDPLCVYTNFKIISSNSFKICHFCFNKDCTESVHFLVYLFTLEILFLPILEYRISFHLFLLSSISFINLSYWLLNTYHLSP